MTYGSLKRRVLEHLNRATINGAEVSPAYNGQSDDLLRIPGLINEAVTVIRTQYLYEIATFLPTNGEPVGDMVKYALPEDFYALCGHIHQFSQGRLTPFRGGKLLGSKELLLPRGEFVVEYRRYPSLLPEDPADDYEYAQNAEVLDAAAWFAAAQLAVTEDEVLYAAALREYEKRLGRMGTPLWAECGRVADVYGGGT